MEWAQTLGETAKGQSRRSEACFTQLVPQTFSLTPGCNPRPTASHVDQLSSIQGDETTKAMAKPFQLGVRSTQSGICCSNLFQGSDRFRDASAHESHGVRRTGDPSFTLSSFDFVSAAVQVYRKVEQPWEDQHPHSARCHQQYISRTQQPRTQDCTVECWKQHPPTSCGTRKCPYGKAP